MHTTYCILSFNVFEVYRRPQIVFVKVFGKTVYNREGNDCQFLWYHYHVT